MEDYLEESGRPPARCSGCRHTRKDRVSPRPGSSVSRVSSLPHLLSQSGKSHLLDHSGETPDIYGVPVRCEAQSEIPQRCSKVCADAQCRKKAEQWPQTWPAGDLGVLRRGCDISS